MRGIFSRTGSGGWTIAGNSEASTRSYREGSGGWLGSGFSDANGRASRTGQGYFGCSGSSEPSTRSYREGSGGWLLGGGSEVDQDMPFIGEVRWIAYDAVPAGWLACDGSVLDSGDYPALFAVIGTTWGAGMGPPDFQLPNLQRRSLVGDGGSYISGPGTSIGDTGGEELHLLTAAESGVPSHKHGLHELKFVGGGVSTIQILTTGSGVGVAQETDDSGTGLPASAVNGHNTYHPVAVMRAIIYAGV